MRITEEFINMIAPIHGRTSCSDENLINGYGGWTGKYDPNTGKKVVEYPRCIRCYLQTYIGYNTDDLKFSIEPTLWYKRE